MRREPQLGIDVGVLDQPEHRGPVGREVGPPPVPEEDRRLVSELGELVNEVRAVLIGPIRQELLSGIPGGLGGALRMNAGAFGREIESITVEVRGFTADGSLSFGEWSTDGRQIFFTAIDAGNADVQRYDLFRRTLEPVATTPESEYSPTPAPLGGLSVVRVEADGTQRLWHFPESGAPEPILPDVKPVGYHAWANDHTLLLFVQ